MTIRKCSTTDVVAFFLALWVWVCPVYAQQPVVYVVPVDGIIDLGLAPFIQRVLNEAEKEDAKAVVLEINTFGGRVDAAVVIRDALLNSKVPTVAFVNKRAISAGALISLAAETIAMADGGTIGAATPVQIGAPGGPAQPVAEKTVSYMRKEFRATAETRKRPSLIAEAMVDADVEIKDVIDKGKLLTLTTEEALKLKVADFQANTLELVLESRNLANATIRYASETWAETLVRFLTNPAVSSLLMTLGILGIIAEIRMPGFGIPGVLGITSLALFFWGHGLVRLAGLEEFLLVGLGVILVGIEVFLIPGFGIFGILGIAALVGGLGLSLVGAGATWEVVLDAIGQVSISLLVAIALSLVVLRVFPRLPFGKRLVLNKELGAKEGYESTPDTDRQWIGKQGTTVSDLHPSGIAHFNGQRVDVVSEGEFIQAGKWVEVVHVDGNRIVVRSCAEPPERGET
ncbi:nodulation protein NfeD [Candidatus Nitronereus thalassa]|uniref:Nodulation protein NfeD n=1 Tax=Candidatus Nitronereus thalassa TaxID=3020898 RepID=A0ABU3KCR5_9BACT|nr:nodulation protein NfeD [Candidatus Nitronereus thalassa]MDT7044083.1 nodulation protein NfeD [Candidatus Nitronereus thalassa]